MEANDWHLKKGDLGKLYDLVMVHQLNPEKRVMQKLDFVLLWLWLGPPTLRTGIDVPPAASGIDYIYSQVQGHLEIYYGILSRQQVDSLLTQHTEIYSLGEGGIFCDRLTQKRVYF